MRSFFTITTPATVSTLLTVSERRTAAGVDITDPNMDANLLAIDERATAAIYDICNIPVGDNGEPTLMQESIEQTFYRDAYDSSFGIKSLILSRRFKVTINSVFENGVLLDASAYRADQESGLLGRLSGGLPVNWCASKIVVSYDAGFSSVPSTLKKVAIGTFTSLITEASRDPYVKSTTVEIPGVETIKTDLWSGSLPGQADGGGIPAALVGSLSRFIYRNFI